MNRNEVTELIVLQKQLKHLCWSQLAEVVGQSKEWTTAAFLGEITLNADQATSVGNWLELQEAAIA